MADYNEDPYPFNREGHVQLKIEKLSEFAREENGQRLSEPVQVVGFPWKILAVVGPWRRHNQAVTAPKKLGFFLQCNGLSTDPAWTCSASAILKLLAQKEGKQDHVCRIGHQFNAKEHDWGFAHFVTFEALMNPDSGWYDEENDSIVLTVDFTVNAPKESYIARSDVLLVNEVEVNVNKHILAGNSDYFKLLFFGEEAKKDSEVDIYPPGTVALFERMLDTMHPQNKPLDDQCIEGVYHLANQFLLTEVETKSRTFLFHHSRRSPIFKYRLADKYGFATLKKKILDSSKKEEFFKAEDFMENLEEFAKLSEPAREALKARIVHVFGHNFFAQEASGSGQNQQPNNMELA